MSTFCGILYQLYVEWHLFPFAITHKIWLKLKGRNKQNKRFIAMTGVIDNVLLNPYIQLNN